ncbi:uncharacterized protein LOC135805156 isoform X2 [Sycon ciliatum]|uniref:uncharacterized protein LOC135805156 isoform X2 n=1 Tax=Sycon ciliatum TaxID=27933 RepID=UPI0031F7097D
MASLSVVFTLASDHGSVRKGGSLRQAHIQDDGVDERTALELKLLRAELKAMREEDEIFLRRLKKMDADLRDLRQLCFMTTPGGAEAVPFFPEDGAYTDLHADVDRSNMNDSLSASTSSGGSNTGEENDKSICLSPPAISGSSVEVDSVFGSPPVRLNLDQSVAESGEEEVDSPPMSPPCSTTTSNHRLRVSSPTTPRVTGGSPVRTIGKGDLTPSSSASLTPLAHSAAVSNLHRPIEYSSSFGESAFMNDLQSNSLMGDDLIAMFNQKSDAVKEELGLSRTSLASSSNSPQTSTPMGGSRNSSPLPPRAASCVELRSASRPESPLAMERPFGGVQRRTGAALSVSMSVVCSLDSSGGSSLRGNRPSPAGSPMPGYSPLNIRALLGQGQTSANASPGSSSSRDGQYLHSQRHHPHHRGLTPQTSAGSLPLTGRKEKLCRKSGVLGPDGQPRSNSVGSSAMAHGRSGSDDASGQGGTGEELSDHLSPLRRGSKAWNNDGSIQEEQFLRGRLVTSPPELAKPPQTSTTGPPAAASPPPHHQQHHQLHPNRTSTTTTSTTAELGSANIASTTPTMFSQKHRRQMSYDQAAGLDVHTPDTQHNTPHTFNALKARDPGDRSGPKCSYSQTTVSTPVSPSRDHQPPSTSDSNLVQSSHLSLSSSSLTGRKSGSGASRFFGNLVRGTSNSKGMKKRQDSNQSLV